MPLNPDRRAALKAAATLLASAPLAFIARPGLARTDDAGRARLHYQATPNAEMRCASCLEFLPGASSQAAGGCKLLPGDDEISPDGYCTAWNTL